MLTTLKHMKNVKVTPETIQPDVASLEKELNVIIDHVLSKLSEAFGFDEEEARDISRKILNVETVLQKMKVTELKLLLCDKGMKTSGNKAELIKRLIAGPTAESERKSCEAPFSEYLLALAICNPNAESYTDDMFPGCIITDVLREQYKEDMKTKDPKMLTPVPRREGKKHAYIDTW